MLAWASSKPNATSEDCSRRWENVCRAARCGADETVEPPRRRLRFSVYERRAWESSKNFPQTRVMPHSLILFRRVL